jgi:hypothetical protein
MEKPLNNKYTKYYNQLVESRLILNRKFTNGCGLEKHHIIPKSLGGTDSKSNLVVFTPREHCLAHMLLSKMYSGVAKAKMIMAISSLMRLRNKNRTVISAREYETLKKAHYKALMEPEFRAYRSELTKKQWTPERRAAVAEKARQQWETGPKRESFSSDEYKKKKSQQMKERWQDPAYQKEQSERTHQAWSEDGYLRSRKKAGIAPAST